MTGEHSRLGRNHDNLRAVAPSLVQNRYAVGLPGVADAGPRRPAQKAPTVSADDASVEPWRGVSRRGGRYRAGGAGAGIGGSGEPVVGQRQHRVESGQVEPGR